MQSTNNNDINMPQTIKPVEVYFKEALTVNTKMYIVYPDWTLMQFLLAIKPLISIDFGLNVNAFELVPVGQYAGERGPAVQQSNDITLHNLWSPNLHIGFYIRRI